jgi:hypothetical protein
MDTLELSLELPQQASMLVIKDTYALLACRAVVVPEVLDPEGTQDTA